MIDITDRVLNAELRGKITTAEEAALHIGPNMNVASVVAFTFSLLRKQFLLLLLSA